MPGPSNPRRSGRLSDSSSDTSSISSLDDEDHETHAAAAREYIPLWLMEPAVSEPEVTVEDESESIP